MKHLSLLLLSASLFLVGCSSSGSSVMKTLDLSEVKKEVIEGKTTKDEVQTKFGSADTVSFTDGGNEIWTYSYKSATSHATNYIPVVNWFNTGYDIQAKEMIILFNQDNIVQRLTVRELSLIHI